MFWNRLMNKGLGRGLIAIFSILICIVVFSPGCGRKAPPVPPGQARPPETSLSESACKECPVLFKRTADIPIEEKDINKKIIYKENLEKGYR